MIRKLMLNLLSTKRKKLRTNLQTFLLNLTSLIWQPKKEIISIGF